MDCSAVEAEYSRNEGQVRREEGRIPSDKLLIAGRRKKGWAGQEMMGEAGRGLSLQALSDAWGRRLYPQAGRSTGDKEGGGAKPACQVRRGTGWGDSAHDGLAPA